MSRILESNGGSTKKSAQHDSFTMYVHIVNESYSGNIRNMTHLQYEYLHDSFTIWNHIVMPYCQHVVHISQYSICGVINESYCRIESNCGC